MNRSIAGGIAMAIACIGLTGCGGGSMYTFNRPGTPPDQVWGDFTACGYDDLSGNPDGAGAAAGRPAKDDSDAISACLAAKGYRAIRMTRAQTTATASFSPAQRKAFAEAIGGAAAPESVMP